MTMQKTDNEWNEIHRVNDWGDVLCDFVLSKWTPIVGISVGYWRQDDSAIIFNDQSLVAIDVTLANWSVATVYRRVMPTTPATIDPFSLWASTIEHGHFADTVINTTAMEFARITDDTSSPRLNFI